MTMSNQKYLKAVYVLLKNGCVRVVDIAQALSVSKPSVCSALKRLSAKGYITHEPYGEVCLTAAGMKKAGALIASYERLRTAIGEDTVLPEGFGYLLGAWPG